MNQDPYDLPEIPKFTKEQIEWRNKAACRGLNVDLFFPNRGDQENKIGRAQQICQDCPVHTQCLDYSLQFSERALLGVWGGKTMRQRRQIRQANNA